MKKVPDALKLFKQVKANKEHILKKTALVSVTIGKAEDGSEQITLEIKKGGLSRDFLIQKGQDLFETGIKMKLEVLGGAEEVVEAVSDAVSDAVDAASEMAEGAADAVAETAQEVANNIKSMIKSVADAMKNQVVFFFHPWPVRWQAASLPLASGHWLAGGHLGAVGQPVLRRASCQLICPPLANYPAGAQKAPKRGSFWDHFWVVLGSFVIIVGVVMGSSSLAPWQLDCDRNLIPN